jgi:hypothetical protein
MGSTDQADPSCLSPQFFAGLQKPQTLTASKFKNEKIWTNNLYSSLKKRYLRALTFLDCEFFDH